MPARNVLESQQSVQAALAGRPAAGCWKLAPGRALSLHPRKRSVLEIAQGRVWLTLSGASPADHVLQAGDRIAIAAGQHVVMEAWSPAGMAAEGVAFDWDRAPALAPVRSAAEWECGVVQPLRDLGQAGGQALGAGGRLALGIARFALFWIAAPRERKTA